MSDEAVIQLAALAGHDSRHPRVGHPDGGGGADTGEMTNVLAARV